MTTLAKLKNEGYDDDKIKIGSAVYDEEKNECLINFVYNPNITLSTQDKSAIVNVIMTDLDGVCKVKAKFNKAYFDEDVVRSLINNYFNEYYKALSLIFSDEDIKIEKNENVKITFSCDLMTKQVLENKDFIGSLHEYLSNKSFETFDITLVEKENIVVEEVKQTYDDSLEKCLAEEELLNKYEVKLGEIVIGKPNEFPSAILIKNIAPKSGDVVSLAGEVKNLRQKTFVRKTVKEDSPSKEQTKIIFTLKDISGEIEVVWFPKGEEISLAEQLEEGKSYLVTGILSNYNENVNVKLSSVWGCEILTKELKKIYRKVNSEYHFVSPEPVTEVTQMDLFTMTKKDSPYWDTHDEVVVFDFETTGLSPKNCNIIEIGAVKIKKGSIIETFQTLINPHELIPEEITEITHISNDMVKDAPSIEQVLPDFYKFTYGAVLSAYNIDFDYQFLSRDGDRLRLKFDNEQIDTLKLARDKVPSLSNYKLGTVVKALDITLNNAHRALADAYATAKVFVKLI